MSGIDYSSEFKQIVFPLRELGESELVLDGEIVALNEKGRARFQELQNRRKTQLPIVYYVFDVLHRNGKDMLGLPLSKRKELRVTGPANSILRTAFPSTRRTTSTLQIGTIAESKYSIRTESFCARSPSMFRSIRTPNQRSVTNRPRLPAQWLRARLGAICITPGPNQVLYACDAFSGRIYKMTLEGKLLGVLGKSGKQLGQFGWIHEIACPSENDLYVAELLNWRVQKLILQPR